MVKERPKRLRREKKWALKAKRRPYFNCPTRKPAREVFLFTYRGHGCTYIGTTAYTEGRFLNSN